MKNTSAWTLIQALYVSLLIGLGIYSFALVDPNLTLVNNHIWEVFRGYMVQLGYHHRQASWNIYLIITVGLFACHFYIVKHYKKFNAVKIALLTALILLMAYPFLSHDFFNYMFDARILTHYGDNPYTHKALNYSDDQWVRFMHWTHRTYPYGPSFLVYTLIPSFLSFGTLILNYIFFKASFIALYVASIWALNKKSAQWALFFATHPLVIMEGIVNSHNDLVAVGLAIVGIMLLAQNTKIVSWPRLLLLLSGGIKYFTAPVLFLDHQLKESRRAFFIMLLTLAPIVYVSITGEIQSWYYLNILIFIPYFYTYISHLYIFFFGLLISYYPFIALGGWYKSEHTQLKHEIILWAVIIQAIYFVILYTKKLKK